MKKLGKRIIVIVLSLAMCIGIASIFAGCGDKKMELKIYAHEGAYGVDFWKEIEQKFEAKFDNVDVKITTQTALNESLNAALGAKQTFPDVVYYGTNQATGYVGTNIIKTKADTLLLDLSELLDTNIPGESVKLGTKIDPDFLNTSATAPFDDGKNYMLPLFYTVNGIFYNKSILPTGTEIPETYAEMAAINPTGTGTKLFGYPRGGYLDNMNIAAAKSTMSDADYKAWMTNGYTDTMYSDSYKGFFTALDSLAPKFMDGFVVAQPDDVKDNTKAFYNGKVAYFVGGSMMPSDAVGWQIKTQQEIDEFNKNCGFMAFPAVTAEQENYFVSMIEQVYPLKTGNAEKEAMAKNFCAYLYSDEAAGIMAENNAMVPITNRNVVAKAAGMSDYVMSLFGVEGKPIFASLPNGSIVDIPKDSDNKAVVWNASFKQVSCFGINPVMGSTISGIAPGVAPSNGTELFNELKEWSQIFNNKYTA